MKRWVVLGIAFAILALALSACANADDAAVRQVVTDAEQTVEDVLNGETSAASMEPYFATLQEGANAAGLVNTRDALRTLLNDHISGVSRVELANFKITQVEVHSDAKLARLQYQVD